MLNVCLGSYSVPGLSASRDGSHAASWRTTWLWYQNLIGGDELMSCVQAQSNVERERETHTERGRLADRGWHVPMSINSPERLIVRNKALYTSHSDKRRSTGTTLSVCECACVCVCVCLTKFTMSAPFPQVPTDTLQRLFQNIQLASARYHFHYFHPCSLCLLFTSPSVSPLLLRQSPLLSSLLCWLPSLLKAASASRAREAQTWHSSPCRMYSCVSPPSTLYPLIFL